MPHIYLVISDKKKKKITQERLLKFHHIDSNQSNKYGYYRYDEGLCQIIRDDIYCIHNKLIELLRNYSKQSKKLFFAKFLLLNRKNENDMFNLSLAKIDKCDFIKLEILDNNSYLQLNTIYQIS